MEINDQELQERLENLRGAQPEIPIVEGGENQTVGQENIRPIGPRRAAPDNDLPRLRPRQSLKPLNKLDL